jgi:protein-disulfide isomerase
MLLIRVLGSVGGLTGIGLLAIQFVVLQKVCTLCLLVDSTAIIIGAITLIGMPEPVPLSKFRLLGWILAAPLPVLIPIGWTAAMMPDTAPEEIQKYWVPGEITIVEVSDFECSHCKKADKVVQEVLKHHKVHLVRLVAPMPSHENSTPAARAFIAARKQGKGEEMAAELFKAETRSPAKCRELAEKLGLNLNDYDSDIHSDLTQVEINRTLELSKTLKQGVPFMWVQNQFIKGEPTPEDLEEAIKKAKPPEK